MKNPVGVPSNLASQLTDTSLCNTIVRTYASVWLCRKKNHRFIWVLEDKAFRGSLCGSLSLSLSTTVSLFLMAIKVSPPTVYLSGDTGGNVV